MRYIIPISGKDSLATALVQNARDESKQYEYVFNPTGLELPEVETWLKNVERHLGKKINRVGADLKEIIKSYNYYLPSSGSRYCTRRAKIEPLVNWLGSEEAVIYYGIRADENRSGFNNSTSPNIKPEYPLVELGIDINAVYTIINNAGLKPPTFFWPELYEKVVNKLAYDPKGRIPEWMFDHLFAWRSRANCDRCFNQRKYEWIGLLCTYPDRYWEASEWESLGSEEFQRMPSDLKDLLFSQEELDKITSDSLEGKFTWSGSKITLKKLAVQKDLIIEKRAVQVAKSVHKIFESKIFEDDANSEIHDTLFLTSCGLMCGK